MSGRFVHWSLVVRNFIILMDAFLVEYLGPIRFVGDTEYYRMNEQTFRRMNRTRVVFVPATDVFFGSSTSMRTNICGKQKSFDRTRMFLAIGVKVSY